MPLRYLRPVYTQVRTFRASSLTAAFDPDCLKTQNSMPSVEPISSFFELNAQSGNRISFCAQCRKLILTNLGERTFSHSLGHKQWHTAKLRMSASERTAEAGTSAISLQFPWRSASRVRSPPGLFEGAPEAVSGWHRPMRVVGVSPGTSRTGDGPPASPGTAVAAIPEPGRNDLCPCGSGRKYKRCCGAI